MPVAAGLAYNGMTTRSNPDKPGVFEVFQYARAGAPDYWCAAGDHVVRYMGQPQNTRIYVVRGLGPSQMVRGRRSVIFTIVPYGDLVELSQQDFGYSMTVDKPGYNHRAAHGRIQCRDSRRWLKFGRR